MMQLLCNGVLLDLYDNAGLQFTHENPLFAFEDLKCERTTQFKLPCTPVNDGVLSLARIPAYKGTGMRVKFPAELRAGVVVKRGYLYVTGYDGTDYNSVFMTGELLGLQAIKNLGKLVDIVTYNNVATYGGAPSTPAAGIGSIWSNVFYKKPDDAVTLPSIELVSLYNDICTQHGITAQTLPSGANGVRIIPNEPLGLKEQTLTFTRAIIGSMSTSQPYPTITNASITVPEIFVQSTALLAQRLDANGGQIIMSYGRVAQLTIKQDLTLKFPDDWDDDLFVGQFVNGGTQYAAEFDFYGDRSFDDDGYITGDSLRGRSVDIPFGQGLCIIHKDDHVKEMPTSSGLVTGWTFGGGDLEASFDTSGKIETLGAYIRLQDNLPDINFTELLKTAAALSGTVLDYTAKGGLTFDTLNISAYASRADVNLTKRGEVKRTFANYAQTNIVRFDDENADKILTTYTIQNVNLEEEKELQVLPFSEGKNSAGLLFVPKDGDAPYLGINGGETYLSRVALPKNAGLQALCNASTQFKCTLRMNLAQYNAITEKTLLIIDNVTYIWTSRSWQKDEAQFTLAKVP